jgi:hypothetical protein
MLDRATKLPKVPEFIELEDESSKRPASKFVLRGGSFYADTLLDAWEAVGSKNTCLHVNHSPNRLTIKLRIVAEQTKQCGSGAVICRDMTCE